VAEALRAQGDREVRIHDVDAELLGSLRDDRPDCVIPLLHGASGEDGALREVLEALGLAYVGSRPTACRVAFDKMLAKARVTQAGIDTPPAVALPHPIFRDLGATPVLQALVGRIGLPLVVKPTRGGSALGVSTVADRAALPVAMVGAFAYGEEAMLEAYVAGTEVAVTVIEDAEGHVRALPVVEIRPDGGLYDYASRYTAGTTEFFAPARLPQDVTAQCELVPLVVHEEVGLRHLSRTDLIVRSDGRVAFLEVNVAPGCTETSLLPQAVEAGMAFVPGAPFYADRADPRTLRLSFVTATSEQIERGMAMLAQVVRAAIV